MKDYKKDFPLLQEKDLVYLDSAATEQRPRQVIEAEKIFYEKYNANPLRGLYELGMQATKQYEDARARTAKFIHAKKAEEIIFTRNTTESINLVAYSYGLQYLHKGDEILISISEHHSNILPWQMVAKKTGAKLVYLECEADGTYTKESIEKAVNEHTKLAAMAQISNVLGMLNPVEKLISEVHRVGGVVLIDAAQSVPHMELDVTELDADFLAFSGHKMLAPMGIGVLYGKMELLNEMPPFLTGGEMIDTVSREGAVYAPVPHKFEAGTVNGAGSVGLAAAMDYLENIGWKEITEREKELTKQLFEGMLQIPYLQIQGSQKAEDHHGIISFTIEGVHPHDIASILDEDNIAIRAGHHCAQPLLEYLAVRSTARVSIAFYNDEQDIRRFLESLKKIRGKMGYENENIL